MIRIVRTARALALVSLAVLVATALAQGMNHGQMRGGAAQPGAASSPMGMGFAGALPSHVVDEASFLVHMIPHHREAVATAEALAARTQRPELLGLLEAIVTSQTAEVESMEAWLDRWHPDVDRDVAYAPMMRDLGTDAAVEDVERAFLEDMIGHHMMAVHDARTLLAGGLAEHEEVAALARSIVTTQMGEMHQMATWLGAWFDVDAPMGMGMGAMGMGSPQGAGAPGMGMTPGMRDRGMGMGAAGGMHGMGGGRGGMHESMHGAMHGAARGPARVRPGDVERLARAFLAGQGVDASAAVLDAATLVYEVTVRVDGATQVLRIDATTGAVEVAPAR